jgi:hypothetical protein
MEEKNHASRFKINYWPFPSVATIEKYSNEKTNRPP